MNKYKIKIKDKTYKVSLECFLLYHSWTTKHFIRDFNVSNKDVFDKFNQNVKYETDDFIKIRLIQLDHKEGVTLISPMKIKNDVANKQFNDIWTNNRMMIWYVDYNTKFLLLDYRNKIIKKREIKIVKSNKINFNKSELDKMKNYDKFFTKLLTNKNLQMKINKDEKEFKKFKEGFFNTKMQSGMKINGYVIDNELILVIPPKPSNYDITYLKNISETVVDILYNEYGNVSMIWSSEIKDAIKKFRLNE